MQTKKLSNMTLDPVTNNCTADLATGRNTQSSVTELIQLPDNQEGRTGKTGPASRESGKLWSPQKADGLGKGSACEWHDDITS